MAAAASSAVSVTLKLLAFRSIYLYDALLPWLAYDTISMLLPDCFDWLSGGDWGFHIQYWVFDLDLGYLRASFKFHASFPLLTFALITHHILAIRGKSGLKSARFELFT